MAKIANGGDLNTIYGSTVFSDTKRCPTYSEVMATNKFVITGRTYANNQLIVSAHVTKYVEETRNFYGITMWYLANGSTRSIHTSGLSFNMATEGVGNTENKLRSVVEIQDPSYGGGYRMEMNNDITSEYSSVLRYVDGALDYVANNGDPLFCDAYAYKTSDGKWSISDRYNIAYCHDEELIEKLNNTYLIPYENITNGYKLFYDNDEMTEGLYDIGVADSAEGVNYPIFVHYYIQEYYSAPVFNSDRNAYVVNKYALRYFHNSNPLLPLSIPSNIPTDSKAYGTVGDIIGDNTLDESGSYNREIGTAYSTNGDEDFDYSGINIDGIIRWKGANYTRCIGFDMAITSDETIEIDGTTYEVIDYTRSYVPTPYYLGSGGGSSTGSTTYAKQYMFKNFSNEGPIYIYKVQYPNTTGETPVFEYLDSINNGEGTTILGLTQTELDNPNDYGFAFSFGTNNYQTPSNGSIVSLSSGDTANCDDYYNSETGAYDFDSYQLVITTPLLPFYDSSISDYALQYVSVNDLETNSIESYVDGNYSVVGLTNYNNLMYSDVEFELRDGETSTVNISLNYNGEEENTITLIGNDSTSDSLSMNGQGYDYWKYTVSFDNAVNLYHKITGDKSGQTYKLVKTLSANQSILVDEIRPLSPQNGSMGVDSYIYVEIL